MTPEKGLFDPLEVTVHRLRITGLVCAQHTGQGLVETWDSAVFLESYFRGFSLGELQKEKKKVRKGLTSESKCVDLKNIPLMGYEKLISSNRAHLNLI